MTMPDAIAQRWALVQASIQGAQKHTNAPLLDARESYAKRFFILWKEIGVEDRQERLEVLGLLVGRPIESANELTRPEVLAIMTHMTTEHGQPDQTFIKMLRDIHAGLYPFSGKEQLEMVTKKAETSEEEKETQVEVKEQQAAVKEEQVNTSGSDLTFPKPEADPVEFYTLMGYSIAQMWEIFTTRLPATAYKAVGHQDYLTDINPAYLNEVLTAVLGPIGLGWWLEIGREPGDFSLEALTRMVGKSGNRYEQTYYLATLAYGVFHYKLIDDKGETHEFSFPVTGGNDSTEAGYALKGMITNTIGHAASRMRCQEDIYKGRMSHRDAGKAPAAKKAAAVKPATVKIIKGLFNTLGYPDDQAIAEVLKNRDYPSLATMTEPQGQQLVTKLSRQIAMANIGDNGQKAAEETAETIALLTPEQKGKLTSLMLEYGYDTPEKVASMLDAKGWAPLDMMARTLGDEVIQKMDTAAQNTGALKFQWDQLIDVAVQLGITGGGETREKQLADVNGALEEAGHTGTLTIRQASTMVRVWAAKIEDIPF